jgi:hypothetical protein
MPIEDRALLDQTMQPYRGKEAVYLLSSAVEASDGVVVARGDFGIDEPCYIDDTGHFNAVESIICYNQLLYFLLAYSIRDRLVPQLAHWTMEDYWTRQLPDVLIHRQSIRYRRPIASHGFSAVLRLDEVDEKALGRSMLRLATSVTFTDAGGGLAEGAVQIVLVNVPEPPAGEGR